MNLDHDGAHKPLMLRRLLLLCLLASAVFLLILLRLWYLQVISGEHFLQLSERNHTRYLTISAPRGPIFDRDGAILVDNRPAFGVVAMRQDVDDPEMLLQRLSALLELPLEDLTTRWQAGRRFPFYRPVPLAEDVSREQLDRVLEYSLSLPGVLIDVQPLRAYPHEDVAAHVFGYLGEITETELRSAEFRGYRAGEFVGKSGLERSLESQLKGLSGQRLVEVDVKGKELRSMLVEEPSPGNKVYLTLHREMQLAGEQALAEHSGAAVALEIETGEILALVSRPAFNPELFARGISGGEWLELLQNPHHPLQNKAISGQYPPASTFKIVTALAAFRAGVATPQTRVECTGGITLGNHEFRCWKRHGHGMTDFRKAMRESCDVWFYKVGQDTGIERIAEASRELGLGRVLGLPLAGERPGLVPDREWKRARHRASWYDGETLIAAIGQGYLLTTPLQLASMTAAVANGGKLMRPQLVKRIEDWQGRVVEETTPELLHVANFSAAHLAAVHRSLEAVVSETGGTGRNSQLEEVKVAGKTGTAQVVRRRDDDDGRRERVIPYRHRNHALFVAYAPADKPEVAVAVVVEHGGSGGAVAAPVARELLRAYFGLKTPESVEAIIYSGD